MSKKEFWAKKIVLECPECSKKYKSYPSMMAHFSRDHGATTRQEQVALFHKAVDNWKKKLEEWDARA